jgi:hypothetical protein
MSRKAAALWGILEGGGLGGLKSSQWDPELLRKVLHVLAWAVEPEADRGEGKGGKREKDSEAKEGVEASGSSEKLNGIEASSGSDRGDVAMPAAGGAEDAEEENRPRAPSMFDQFLASPVENTETESASSGPGASPPEASKETAKQAATETSNEGESLATKSLVTKSPAKKAAGKATTASDFPVRFLRALKKTTGFEFALEFLPKEIRERFQEILPVEKAGVSLV